MDYDLIVIGGGAAGLTASGFGATLGAKTLLIERHRLGGDCTWTGCVPSKTLLKAAKVAQQSRYAARYGLTDQPVAVDGAALFRHVRRLREGVYEDADSPERLESLGVQVRAGQARFIDRHTLEISSDERTERVTARYFVIAAGGRPRAPAIEGLDGVPYLTSENLFELEDLPRRLAVLGGGPVGTEMAQAFARLGAEVTVVNREERILAKDEPELSGLLQSVLASEGVRYHHKANLVRVRQEAGDVRLTVEQGGSATEITADVLLVATGRVPNVEHLNLDAAGIAGTERGITVDEHGRSSTRHIYAVGDVTGAYQLTHMSEHTAKVAVTNALLKVPTKIDRAHVPWVTYTDPELAHVGATEADLRREGTAYAVYRFPYAKLDRAITDGETTGWIIVYATRRTGKILGASILGESAGDLICEYALAMRHGITLRQISDTIHPYPTFGQGVRRAADQWYVRRYDARLVRLLQKVFRYKGPVQPGDPDRIL